MSRKKLERLKALIVGLRLIPSAELESAVASLPSNEQTPEALLQALTNRHLLTPYQRERLASDNPVGLVLGDYKLTYRINSGSFARVFRASSLTNGQMVAVKWLREKWAEDADMVTQFRREAAMVKRLKHKNIVPIYDIGSQNDNHYFTMEFVQGGNLKEFLDIRKKLAPIEASRYILDIAEALEYAMSQGVSHRDLKLSNVLVSTQGVAKLVDFGLGGDDGISGWAKGDGQQRALEYATLEKGTGAPVNDPRSDLFFLGTIFYELLTGTPPYNRTRDREARKQLSRYQNIRPLRSLMPDMHKPVERVVQKMLHINPNERFQTPSEVVSDMRELLRYLGDATDSEIPVPAAPVEKSELPSVLCVEHRAKVQEVLRKRLGDNGYRVLMMSDLARAERRLEKDPPDCLLIMGPAFDAEAASLYRTASARVGNDRLAVLLILSDEQASWADHLTEDDHAKVMRPPVKFPKLLETLTDVLAETKSK